MPEPPLFCLARCLNNSDDGHARAYRRCYRQLISCPAAPVDAKLYRRKGQLLLRDGHTEAAEKLNHKAFKIARRAGSQLCDLRAAANLAKLRRDQPLRGEARDPLGEGFAKPDLKTAKALPEELI